MQKHELPKSVNKALRSLSRTAYEAELKRALDGLSRDFDRWKAAEMDSFELADRIHQFHDGPNRDLFVRYNSRLDPRFLVSCALKEGFLNPESIPQEVLPYLDLSFKY